MIAGFPGIQNSFLQNISGECLICSSLPSTLASHCLALSDTRHFVEICHRNQSPLPSVVISDKPAVTGATDYTQGPLDGSLYAQIAGKRPKPSQDQTDMSQKGFNERENGGEPQRRSDESDSELLEPPEVMVEVKHQDNRVEEFRPNEVTMETTVKSAHLTNGNRPVKIPPKTPPKPLPSPDVTNRPITPGANTVESTPQIDTGLVGQDRYDPQSKAFSYVPAQALQEHFKSPKKQTKLVPHTYSDYDEDYSSLGINSDIESLAETPAKSLMGPTAFPQHSTPISEELIMDERPKKATVTSYPPSSHLSTSQPLLVDNNNSQKSPAVKHSLDDFLDPNFYLNFNFDTFVPETKPNVKPPEKPRRDMEFEDFINSVDFRVSPPRKSEPTLPALPKVPVKAELATQKSYPGALETVHSYQVTAGPFRTASIDGENSIDGEFMAETASSRPWRQAVSSRSVGSTPVHRGWLEDSYPKPVPPSHQSRSRMRSQSATQSDIDPDEWLEAQLEKLKIRKVDNDPEFLERKQKEKELLDELRYINEERQLQRGRNEADYTVEGVGTKKVDPFAPEELLKPRLSLEHSLCQPHPDPYRFVQTGYGGNEERSRQPSRSDSSADRYGRVTGKPPTPPPRERSRTPPTPRRISPITVPPVRPISNDTTDFGGRNKRPSQPATFENLESILYEAEANTNRYRREPPSPAPRHRETPTYNSAQQSPKSILKKPKDDVSDLIDRLCDLYSFAFSCCLQRSTPVTFSGDQQRFYTNGPTANGEFPM